ncbi:adult-specific rigid cuticular protein 15.7-like [Tropilaelaps mercedesae]|uniref:Adult-specific rigid cuticular protein 15.7-like n=1 Tax=Tropilaelaps mercedesae TaxID=418985 RepID=A0A1V9XSF1_9ACAR|nr:adult-specific rigid cuticular protein 15.7-like [Tropilaelaps mercedesae]
MLSSASARGPHGGHHWGSSSVNHHQDDHGNFDFAYDIKDCYGNVNGRKEKRSHGHVVGSYYLGDVDGRHRIVHYIAEKHGFRAEVKTNEHCTKTSHPAAVSYHSGNGKHLPSGHHYGHHHCHGAGHYGYGEKRGDYGGPHYDDDYSRHDGPYHGKMHHYGYHDKKRSFNHYGYPH